MQTFSGSYSKVSLITLLKLSKTKQYILTFNCKSRRVINKYRYEVKASRLGIKQTRVILKLTGFRTSSARNVFWDF